MTLDALAKNPAAAALLPDEDRRRAVVQCAAIIAAAAVSPPLPAQSADGMLSITEAAQLLELPASWVKEQVRVGKIPSVKVGKYRRIRRPELSAWQAAQTA